MISTRKRSCRSHKQAKELGIELFVLDDGWFGKRDDDHTADWETGIVNENKLPDGTWQELVEKIAGDGHEVRPLV